MDAQGVTLLDEMGRMAPGWGEAFEAYGVVEAFGDLNAMVEQERGRAEVAPPRGRVLEAFKWFSPRDTRVVILGQDPYPGQGDACGLSFSVPAGRRLPGSLRNIFRELSAEYNLPPRTDGDLTSWARQGVLLLNAVLTVRVGAVNSHSGRGWERVADAALSAVNARAESCVFLLWGSAARRMGWRVDTTRHCVLTAAHPSPLSARRGFFGCGHFKRANAYLRERGRGEIDWYAGERVG